MIFSKIYSAQANLLKAEKIDVEVDISNGLHAFSIIGLPDKSIEESKDRVSSSIKNSGFISPKQKNQKIIIALSPAHIKKTGSVFDLAMALAYLKSSQQIKFNSENKMFVGELSLDGKIKPIRGIIQIVLLARKIGIKEIYIPNQNCREAQIVNKIKIYGVKNLKEIIEHLTQKKGVPAIIPQFPIKKEKPKNFIFNKIRGNESAKQSLLIAACGGHNICLYGPPGTGKTMLSKSFAEILPPLNYQQILETSSIHSIYNNQQKLITRPPFRSPHHTASYSAIVGGGKTIRPGEITLAHNGVFFMDEFPEFNRRVIDSLRQPIEEREITISRAEGEFKYPCNFILIIALNPCPCGFKNSKIKKCQCSVREIENYKRKISGPIADRIDIFTEVSEINYEKLLNKSPEKEEDLMEKIKNIRKKQISRQGKLNVFLDNNDLEKNIDKLETKTEFNKIAQKLNLSVRVYYKILKVARTIADISGSEKIKIPHILEALQQRNKLEY